MQRITSTTRQRLPQVIRVCNTHQPIRNMSLFSSRNSSPFFGEFAPMFRLMDDYATHVASKDGGSSISKSFRSFTPKFDVKENKENYELHGELPGIDQKNINIEFSDAQTLTIKGRTEHHREEGTRPAGLIEGEVEQGKLTQGESNNGHYHKPSVEDEGANSGSSSTQVQKSEQQQSKKNESRYWVSERSVGEFARTFAFPTRVDQDNVKASLKDGILSIVIPKAQAPSAKRITIE
ncbi:heat shock protein 30 [Zymoseptoria brevis]|uniref:Heat shock protein 30 n=3 Tax=Zymoseptoria TaxID=1047167 RepID=A0A0F4GS10_9PEZI|nr:heat shock protein 30 [Zymoseptoria brevis]